MCCPEKSSLEIFVHGPESIQGPHIPWTSTLPILSHATTAATRLTRPATVSLIILSFQSFLLPSRLIQNETLSYFTYLYPMATKKNVTNDKHFQWETAKRGKVVFPSHKKTVLLQILCAG